MSSLLTGLSSSGSAIRGVLGNVVVYFATAGSHNDILDNVTHPTAGSGYMASALLSALVI
jgi:hypothetical protein